MLKQAITDQMKQAMKSQDKQRLGVIRLVGAAIKQKEVDERIELNDTDVIAILEKMVKQRNEAIKQFTTAKRDDLAAKEKFEIEVIKGFLPEPLTKAEVDELVRNTIAKLQATSIKDMGKVMAELKPQLQGKADMAEVSSLIKTLLSAS